MIASIQTTTYEFTCDKCDCFIQREDISTPEGWTCVQGEDGIISHYCVACNMIREIESRKDFNREKEG